LDPDNEIDKQIKRWKDLLDKTVKEITDPNFKSEREKFFDEKMKSGPLNDKQQFHYNELMKHKKEVLKNYELDSSYKAFKSELEFYNNLKKMVKR
jgi:hypothetical protein